MGILNRKSSEQTKKKFTVENSFLTIGYQTHNMARLKHLNSLCLELKNKKVLEVGAGIGDHTFFYLINNCEMLVTEGRPELVEVIKKRFHVKTEVLDLEKDLQKLKLIGRFDIVHCYGILYHLSNPIEVITALADIGDQLFLETCVSSDNSEYGHNLLFEERSHPSQAIHGAGCRPNRKWLYDNLKKIFPFVYLPNSQPDHLEFPKDWSALPPDDLSNYQLKRAVFICSKSKIINDTLNDKFIQVYK